MPSKGYQEFLFPRDLSDLNIENVILTSDRYTNLKNYDVTWKQDLGQRIIGSSMIYIGNLKIIRNRTFFEYKNRILISNILAVIKSEQPDIIFIHGSVSLNYFYIMLFLAKQRDQTIVVDNHVLFQHTNGKPLYAKLFYFIVRCFNWLFSKKVKYYFGVEKDCCRQLVRYEGISPFKVRHLSLGYSSNALDLNLSGISEIEKILKLDDNYKLIQTGKLSQDKNPLLTLQAFQEISKTRDNISLYFFGKGSELQNLQNYTKVNSILNVYFFDPIPSEYVPQLLSLFDLLIIPEGSSLSVYEAYSVNVRSVFNSLQVNLDRQNCGLCVCFDGSVANLVEVILTCINDRSTIPTSTKKYSYHNIGRSFLNYLK